MDHQNNDDDLNTNDGIPEGIPKPEKFIDTVSAWKPIMELNTLFYYCK